MHSDDLTAVPTAFTYGGDALARMDDGRAVFVPFCLPGERVRIQLTEKKEHFARARLLEVIEASPGRVTPRCKHFGVCGGCHYQHLSQAAQIEAKAAILRNQLTRIGHIQDPPVTPARGAGAPWNYRNQMQFQLDPGGRLGFVASKDRQGPEEIIPIQECHLPNTAIIELWPKLAFGPDSGIQRVAVRSGSDGELMLVLELDSPTAPELPIGPPISIAQVSADGVLLRAGDDHIRLRVKDREFQVSPTSFFQVNEFVAGGMVDHLLGCIPASPGIVIDAYCGVGLFSAFLAPRCRKLVGIESSPAACDDFGVNLDEFDNVDLYQDAAERVLPVLDLKPEVIVVDPPRSGLDRTTLGAVVRMSPSTMVYVSCDPATLARDAARLIAAGYRLENVTPFDMFPQTYHIESISLFRR